MANIEFVQRSRIQYVSVKHISIKKAPQNARLSVGAHGFEPLTLCL
jgi:hypothetical protein